MFHLRAYHFRAYHFASAQMAGEAGGSPAAAVVDWLIMARRRHGR